MNQEVNSEKNMIGEKIKAVKIAGRIMRFILTIAIIANAMIIFAIVVARHTIGIFLTIFLLIIFAIPLWLLIRGLLDVKYDVENKIKEIRSKNANS